MRKHLVVLIAFAALSAPAFGVDLFTLAAAGTAEQVKAALVAGADPNEVNPSHETPLMVAARKNSDPGVIRALLDAGAKAEYRLNIAWPTALMIAAAHASNPEVVAALIAGGSKIDAVNSVGQTALMWAAHMSREPKVVMALLHAGADPSLKSNTGKTAADYAAKNGKLVGTRAYDALKAKK